MDKIYLSDAGPKVSTAIYGFWRWKDSSLAAAENMERIINLCLELGINSFAHSDIYGGYEIESLFGRVMANRSFRREDVVLFSKCGLRIPHPNRPEIRVRHYNTSAKHITESVNNSLRDLRTDYIDIFLLNQVDPLSNLEETALAIENLRNSGKIRNVGVSHFSVFQHQLLASYLRIPIVTNYVELSLLNTAALDNGQLDYMRQRYMRPLAAAPLAGGRIENGKDEQAVKVRTKLEEIGRKYHSNVESTAVAWLYKLGALPLIGTMNEGRIRNIAASFNIDLDIQDWYDLYNTSRGLQPKEEE
jgi:predicted oxidoreductase